MLLLLSLLATLCCSVQLFLKQLHQENQEQCLHICRCAPREPFQSVCSDKHLFCVCSRSPLALPVSMISIGWDTIEVQTLRAPNRSWDCISFLIHRLPSHFPIHAPILQSTPDAYTPNKPRPVVLSLHCIYFTVFLPKTQRRQQEHSSG